MRADLIAAVRYLRRSPVHVLVLTLSLGIGMAVSVAVFSVIRDRIGDLTSTPGAPLVAR